MIRDPPLPSRRDPTSPGSAERYGHGKNDCFQNFHPSKMVKKIENISLKIDENGGKKKGNLNKLELMINGCKG